MKTRTLKIALLLTITLNLSCKNDVKLSEYKYTDKANPVDCQSGYDPLLKEAFYAFEKDIINKYAQEKQNKSRAYRTFLNNVAADRLKTEDLVSTDSKAIFDVLKSKDGLFTNNHLNYNSSVFNCISAKIKDKALKQTLDALISTNSMSSKLYSAALRSSSSYIADTNMSMYIALDLYYSKFFNIDFSKVDLAANTPKPKPIDFNKIPKN